MSFAAEHRPNQTSPRAKLSGVFALLFFLLAFVGQACHSHQPPQIVAHAASHALSGHADRSTAPEADTAETCSLCIAMHSATPASERTVPGGAPVRAGMVQQQQAEFADRPVAFDRLSRPPPTLSRAV